MSVWGSAARHRAWGLVVVIAIMGAARAEESQPLPVQLMESDPQVVGLLRQAQELLAEHRAKDACTLLEPREIDLGGTPFYDYLLGICLLDTSHPRDAVFALERVVAAQPDFAGARMELARAYYEVGQLKDARIQFRYLLSQAPPPETRAVIEHYIAALDGRSATGGSRWSGQIQLGGGYDSNANGSTNEQNFLGFTLNPRNVQTGSSFGELTASGANTLALSPDSGLLSSLEVTHRANPEASFIDQTVLSGGTQLVVVSGPARYTGGLNLYGGWLDGHTYDHGGNLDLSAARRTAHDLEWGATVRAGIQQYEQESLRVLDVNRYLTGLSLTKLNIGTHSGSVGITLLGGRDDARRPGSPYDADRYGARLFTNWILRPQSSLYAEVSAQAVDFRGNGFFGDARRDDEYGALVALDIQNWPAARWGVTPRVRYVKNDSNVSLYRYDRVEGGLYIHRNF